MIKAQNSGIMKALKWKLIRVYSFVATKNSSNLDSSCDMLARTLTLEPENSTESQLCHSLRVRMDNPSNFRFLTGLSWESEDVCVWMYFTCLSMMQTWKMIDYLHSHSNSHSNSKAKRTSSGSWVLEHILHVLLPLSLIAAWLEQRKCSDFSNTDSFHTFKCQK